MSAAIIVEVADGIARLTLNRPARLNAFNSELALAWRDATAGVVGRDDVRAIVVDAAGPAFCAGGDVQEMATAMTAGSDLTTFAGVINEGIRSLTESAIPVVAAAHGTTAGGGLGILLCSDYAVVGESSKVGSLYANIGLTPDLSVTAQLARAVGERRALQLVLNDRMLSAADALAWGLVAEIVGGDESQDEADAVRARAMDIARFWVRGAANAYGQAKRLVRAERGRSFAEQLHDEAETIGAAFDGPEGRAGVAAFAAASTGTRTRT